MGFLDRLLGRDEQPDGRDRSSGGTPRERSADEVAVERYRYLLRTAPPERIEEVHLEAFRKLTPEQREILFRQLSSDAAEGDAPVDDRPESLARSATRSEMRAPGTLERTLGPRGGLAGGGGAGMGMGGMIAGSMLGTIAGVVVGSAIAQALIPDAAGQDPAGADGADGGADAGADGGADAGATDAGGADAPASA
ncbi:hypothetical protein, partial [Clavibacter michiganensis]|uniref:hypothetical protein n=1 Tax=Clavibacter michiganensis TaxID=28447 RepID=UPI00292D9A5E